jgi:hypothetical protein
VCGKLYKFWTYNIKTVSYNPLSHLIILIHCSVPAGVTGVVYFGHLPQAKALLRAAGAVAGAGRLQWIFPETIGNDPLLLENIQFFKVGRGTVTLFNCQRDKKREGERRRWGWRGRERGRV